MLYRLAEMGDTITRGGGIGVFGAEKRMDEAVGGSPLIPLDFFPSSMNDRLHLACRSLGGCGTGRMRVEKRG